MLLTKNYFYMRYELSKTTLLKHFLCGRGFARDVDGGTRGCGWAAAGLNKLWYHGQTMRSCWLQFNPSRWATSVWLS